MAHTNIEIIEIKARCGDTERIRGILRDLKADFRGVDNQRDTYFKVPTGRLKLREGEIENTLIHYDRPDQAGPKKSDVSLYQPNPDSDLKAVLAATLDVLVVVEKKREIYFIDNVKFHIDSVPSLGEFIEIEAIDADGQIGADTLLEQCEEYVKLFGIEAEDLIDRSYSDMLLEKSSDNLNGLRE